MPGMEQRLEVSVAGVRSPVAVVGDQADPEAVVFVHGNPGSAGDWAGLMAQVAPFGRALAPDMPGFGKADGYARHLGALLDELCVARAHLVLHDFGGPWGLAWASDHLSRVASVTLINIGIMPGYRWHYMARIWQSPVIGELSMLATTRAGMRMALRHGNPRGLPRAYLDQVYDHYDRGTRRAILRLYRNTEDLGALSSRLASALGPHRLPALVVWGERDPYVSAAFAEVQQEFFDVKRLVRLADSGHWPMIDNPEATAGAVVPFLRAQWRRDASRDGPSG